MWVVKPFWAQCWQSYTVTRAHLLVSGAPHCAEHCRLQHRYSQCVIMAKMLPNIRPSHLYALLHPHLFCSCLGEGGTPVSFWTCNSLSITFSFFSLALSSSGFLFYFFLSLNAVDAHLHFSHFLFILYMWLDFYCLIILRLILSCLFKRYLVL